MTTAAPSDEWAESVAREARWLGRLRVMNWRFTAATDIRRPDPEPLRAPEPSRVVKVIAAGA